MPTLLLLLHVFSAIAFYCGLAGRLVTFELARRAADHRAAIALLRASDFFERRLAIPGSMLVLLFGLLVTLGGPWGRQLTAAGVNAGWLIASVALFLALIPAIPLYLLPARKRREAAVEASTAAGEITPALRAALDDRGVRLYRAVELAVVVGITWLMVAKPF